MTNLGRQKPLKCSLSCSCQWCCGRNLADLPDKMLQNKVVSVELQPLVEATTMLQLLIWLNNMVIECCLFALSTTCFRNINWLTGVVLHKYSHSITLLLAVSYVNIPGESSPCLVDSYTCVRQAMASRSDEDEESHERFGQGLDKARSLLGGRP